MASEWLVLFPKAFECWLLVTDGVGWLLLFLDGFWMDAGLESLANRWLYITCDVNVGNRGELQRTWCQSTLCVISMLRIQTARVGTLQGGRGVAHRTPSLLPVSCLCLPCTIWHRAA